MGRWDLLRRAPVFIGAAILLSGCGGAPSAGVSSLPQPSQYARHPLTPPQPAAFARKNLLYASRSDCDVYVFTYPRGTLVQTIDACGLGFGPAIGLCSDKAGNVFMSMGAGFSVFEFAHGGTEPIAQIESDSLLPLGCAVDPRSGALAVASAEGNVAVFKTVSSAPQEYYLNGVTEFYFCTYDDRGNLFADGEHQDNSFALAELPKGGSELEEIAAPAGFGTGDGIQWDGRHVAIGATQSANAFSIERVRVIGHTAKVIGTTRLDMTPNALTPFQFWIRGGTVVQPENRNGEIGFWSYPAGGEQTKGIPVDGSSLVGVTVSVAPRR